MLAKPGLRGLCGSCKGEVLARCGEINIEHWAHLVAECDPWSEPESKWHADWKKLADPSRCEFSIPPHRADILGINNEIIELQHSTISTEEITEREEFYGKHGGMLWVFDARGFQKNLTFLETVYRGKPCFYFTWKWPRRSYIKIKMPLFFDIDDTTIAGMDGVMLDIVKRHGPVMLEVQVNHGCRSGIASIILREEFIRKYIRHHAADAIVTTGLDISHEAWLRKVNREAKNKSGKIYISKDEQQKPEIQKLLWSRVLDRVIDPRWGIERWKARPKTKSRHRYSIY